MAINTNTSIVGPNLPSTSQKMQGKALFRSGTLREKIYNYIKQSGGATDDEMELALNRSHQSVSGTRRSLVKDGYVEASRETRLTRYGNEAIVWVIT